MEQEIFGYMGRFMYRDEFSGASKFFLVKDVQGRKETIICEGFCMSFPHLMPLRVSGDLLKNNGWSIMKFDSAIPCGYSPDAMQQYLCSRDFTGVGAGRTKSIIDAFGTDIFDFVRTHKDDICQVKSVPKDVLDNVINRIRFFTDFEPVWIYFNAIGAGFHAAKGLYHEYGPEAVDKVKEDPYLMLKYEVPFASCEKLAFEYKMEMCDERRVPAIVYHAMQSVNSQGSTVATFRKLWQLVRFYERKAGCYHTNPLFIAEEIMSDRYVLTENGDHEILVSTVCDYMAEKGIQTNIDRILRSSEPLQDMTAVEDIEKDIGISYSEEQRDAFSLIKKSGVGIITGGPGTGKTTLLNGLIRKYRKDNPGKKIALCAPTGCAARRMTEKCGMIAQTIHKLLDIRPYENITDSSPKQISADLVVVDESSMMDIYVAARLLSAIKNGSLLLLIGDADQLPSVAPGAVFRDLIESGILPIIRLKTIYRQDARSVIADNCEKILHGDPELSAAPNFYMRQFKDEKSMIMFAGKLFRAQIHDAKLYTPTRQPKFAAGTFALNEMLRIHDKEVPYITYGRMTYSVGDKVMFTKNDYEMGYYNGETGIITAITEITGQKHLTVHTDDDSDITFDAGKLKDLDLAYALTAHKSQGSECDNAIVLIPDTPQSLKKRNLLYVEVSRARKNVAILYVRNSLNEALSDDGIMRRDTRLCEMLQNPAPDQEPV